MSTRTDEQTVTPRARTASFRPDRETMRSEADRLVESYEALTREHPQLVAEALRRLSRALPPAPSTPIRSTGTARSIAPRHDDADSAALPRFLHARMRQAMDVGATDDALEFARRLRARATGLVSYGDVEASSHLLDTGIVEAACHRPIPAIADFAHAMRLAAASDEQRHVIAVHSSVVNAAYGRLDEATRLLEITAETPQSGIQVSPLAHLAAALIAVERLDRDAEKRLLMIADSDLGSFWPYAVLARVRWELALGSYGAALNVVAIAEAGYEARAGTLAESVLALCRAAALTGVGHPRAAIEVIDTIRTFTPALRLARARALLHLGDDDTADEHVSALLGEESTGPTVLAEAALIKVWIAERRGSHDIVWAIDFARNAAAAQNFARVLTAVPNRISALISPTHARLRDIPEPIAVAPLRGSQLTVLRELLAGGTLEEIAARLQLSIHTVRTHTKAIYKRLEVHTRAQAVAVARARRLLD